MLVSLMIVVGIAGCTRPRIWEALPGGSLKVLASFPPLYCFAKNVAGDHAKVYSMLQTEGPHGFEPTPNKALLAREADVFFYNGLTLDDFVTRIVNASGNRKLAADAVAEALPKDMLLKMAEQDHGHAHGDGHHHHHHGEFDPHTWLGIPQAVKMVEQISGTLQKADPAHKEDYAARAKKYIAEIEALESLGKDRLADKKNRKLVTMHESLGYFAKSFDLDIVGSIQQSPNVEPDARTLTKLVKLCKEKDVRVIAIEPQFKAGAANTLKRELERNGVKATLIEIDPMETVEPGKLDEGFYVRTMKRNIDNLAKGLP
jgi:ABC-type Zn uptake system ZnuABC Zn-binding protein ZnuA